MNVNLLIKNNRLILYCRFEWILKDNCLFPTSISWGDSKCVYVSYFYSFFIYPVLLDKISLE